MEIIKENPVPIYELECNECHSVIHYQKSDAPYSMISCPVCGTLVFATGMNPVTIRGKRAKHIEVETCEENTTIAQILREETEAIIEKITPVYLARKCMFCDRTSKEMYWRTWSAADRYYVGWVCKDCIPNNSVCSVYEGEDTKCPRCEMPINKYNNPTFCGCCGSELMWR